MADLTVSLPTPQDDEGIWGGILNTAINAIVSFVNALQSTVTTGLAAKVNKAGDSLSGRLVTKSVTTALVNLAGNAPTIDTAAGQYFAATITGATNFQGFTNSPASAGGFVLYLTNGGSAAVAFPASVQWPNGTQPVFTTAGTDVLVFLTRDGGASWQATVALRDVR